MVGNGKKLLVWNIEKSYSIPLHVLTSGWNDYVGKATSPFLSADMPFFKLRNPELQSLFQLLGRKALST